MRYYCTYFDHHYLPRGLALYDSLCRLGGAFELWVLCLSEECEQALQKLKLPGVETISMREFEAGDAPLQAAKRNRSQIEYFFTCTPSLPLFLFKKNPAMDAVTYLDGDLYFFGAAEEIFADIGEASIAITPHRFPPVLRDSERYGIYNVGWVTFRRDANAFACLEWWRERCLEWCHDREENGRFADQKYLDCWPAKFAGVKVIQHPGVNLAPWNLAGHQLEWEHGRVYVDGRPLLVFHFHGLKQLTRRIFDPQWTRYRVSADPILQKQIYLPYLDRLVLMTNKLRIKKAFAGINPRITDNAPSPPKTTWRGALKKRKQLKQAVENGEYLLCENISLKSRLKDALLQIFHTRSEPVSCIHSQRPREPVAKSRQAQLALTPAWAAQKTNPIQMNANNSIGVVLPTLNCASLLPAHLESMQEWLDLVSEVVVVDSHSTDGTVQLIHERLQHPQLRIHLHPRGLYQSWNFGLGQLRTKYAYISTVGDSISRSGLEHLHTVAERLQCDVVVSKPRFITNEGLPITDDLQWPINDVLSTLKITEPVCLEGMKLFILVMLNTTGAILGSSASNLYRARILQDRPFPTDFGTVGDGAWSVANVFDYRLGVTPEIFSTFRHHPKAYSKEEYAVEDICWKLFLLAGETLRQRLVTDAKLRNEDERIGCKEFTSLVGELREWQHRLETLRKRRFPWVFNPAAWHGRSMRNHFRRLVNERKRTIVGSLKAGGS
jgi:Glycosyl transferase family 2